MTRRMKSGLGMALALAAAFIAACGDVQDGSGAARVKGFLSSSDVVRVEVTISGAGIDPALVVPLVQEGASWGGTIGVIPAGPDRTFSVEALDAAGTALYRGQATGVTIEPGRTTLVAITAQQALASPPVTNAAPVIDALVVSSATVAPGGTVALTVAAHDPNPGDTLTYDWSAPAGSFSSVDSPSTTLTAPTMEGSVPVTISVRDPRGATARMTVHIRVTFSAGRGSAEVTVTINTWPVIEGVTADPARVDVGGQTQLGVTASDPDGDSLSYSWSSDCSGVFSDSATATPTFVLAVMPAAGACTFSVVAGDGRGGEGVGDLTIAAGPEPLVNQAPQVTLTYQSATRVGPGGTVVFRVSAVDPEGTALAFSWSATAGTLGPVTTAGDTSEVTWTTPAAAGMVAIDAHVVDAMGAQTTQAFAVDVTSGSPASWTARTSGTTNHLTGVAWSPTAGLVAVGFNGTILHSGDGVTWTAASPSLPAANYYSAVTYGNGQFVAVGTNMYGAGCCGPIISTSPDGVVWTAQSPAATAALTGVAYGNGTYVAVGNYGSIQRSSGAVSWTSVSSGTSNHLDGVSFLNGQFVIMGHGGTVMTSTAGDSWTLASSGTGDIFFRAVFGNGTYVAPGYSSSSPAAAVRLSPDLSVWTTALVADATYFRNAAFGGGLFAATGDGLLTSLDGTSWTRVLAPSSIQGGDIVWTGTQFVAVGGAGTIFTTGP